MTFARIRALVIVGVLVAAALVFVSVAILKDNQTHGLVAEGCPKDAVPADARLPEPKGVKINVFNATDTPGLATQVATDLHNRLFTVVKTGNDPKGQHVEHVAILRYGPKTVGAAWLLRAYFLDKATPEFDIKRTDDVVDVVVGNEYRQLASVTETNQALAQLGNPTLPKGTCAINAH
jgi:hypothetical protein